MDKVTQAYEEFLIELFGSVPEDVSTCQVTRSKYTETMKRVQEKYELEQGKPDFLEWIFTCVGRSPIIIEDTENTNEGAGYNESTSTSTDEA